MNFIPFERVGIFQLDDDIRKYSDVLSKYFHEPIDEYGSEYFHVGDDETVDDTHFLQIKDNRIRTIFCYHELIYKNVNLIGLTLAEFKKITNADYVGEIYEADIFEDEPSMYDYEFTTLGLTVRTHYDRVHSITVSGHWSYEDD